MGSVKLGLRIAPAYAKKLRRAGIAPAYAKRLRRAGIAPAYAKRLRRAGIARACPALGRDRGR